MRGTVGGPGHPVAGTEEGQQPLGGHAGVRSGAQRGLASSLSHSQSQAVTHYHLPQQDTETPDVGLAGVEVVT